MNILNGGYIKKIRLSKNLGLNETAEKVGISGSYLSNIEKGIKKNPSTEILQKIADFLNVSINDFFDNDASETTEYKPKLTIKEQDKLDKKAEEILEEMEMSLSQNKDSLTEEDYEVLLASMKGALQAMTLRNKEKYTPKKYKNKK